MLASRTRLFWMALVALAALAVGGCTLISGVNDLEPSDASIDGAGSDGAAADAAGDAADSGSDAEADAEVDAEVDAEAGMPVVDAHIVLSAMSPHASQIVDCAVVDADSRLLARGLFRMPPATASDYPDVEMTLTDVLVGAAPFELQFYADRNGNQQPDVPPTDHSWVRDFDAQGEVRFAHSFPLDDLTGLSVQAIGDDLVFKFASGADDPRDAFALQDGVIELRVSPPDGRTVGALQLHPDLATPLPDQIVVAGIVDAGNTFTVKVFADGMPVSGGELEVTAPDTGPLEIELTKTLLGL